MTIISVDAKALGQELAAWAVPHNYAMLFMEKSIEKKWPCGLTRFFL